MADQGDRKTVRAFQCRDYLYEIFDRLSEEHDCSVDYLINEAMREYARSREQAVSRLGVQHVVGSAVAAGDGALAAGVPQPPPTRPAPLLTPMPGRGPTAPPPLPGSRPSDAATRRVLVLEFDGQDFPVEKDEFIIGRGAKAADLAIRDGNISRRHAAIVFHDGVYFMKDLGSTNGIEFAGQRVESKRIEDGDVY
ncbi:MAG: FHA domain-containing protein, partial [Myxococcota bacterium]